MFGIDTEDAVKQLDLGCQKYEALTAQFLLPVGIMD